MISALSAEHGKILNEAVEALSVQAEACAVLLTDLAGNVIVNTPYRDPLTVQTIGALGAGSFSATRELAALTGEEAFRSISHQGTDMGIHVRGIDESFLLVIIFDRNTTLGLVKLYTDKAVPELTPVLKQAEAESVQSAGGAFTRFEMAETEKVFASA